MMMARAMMGRAAQDGGGHIAFRHFGFEINFRDGFCRKF